MLDVMIVVGLVLTLAWLTLLARRRDARLPALLRAFSVVVLIPAIVVLSLRRVDAFAYPIYDLVHALATAPDAPLRASAHPIQMLAHALDITNFWSLLVALLSAAYASGELPRIMARQPDATAANGGST